MREAADGETSSAGRGFFRRDGVIYRRQKRAGRQEVMAEHKAESQHPLDGLSAEELRALQGSDPTIATGGRRW